MDAGEYVPDEITNLMVRNRIDEPDAEPGFLLDGYPRTLSQVEELDGMIKFTGHELDAVVVLTVDSEELVQRLLARAETDGRSDDTEDVIRRRQEVYAEQTEPLIEVYRDRDLLIEVDGMGEVDEVTAAHLRRARGRPRELSPDAARWASVTAGSRSRPPSRSARCGWPGCWSGRPSSCSATSVRPGITTGDLDAIAEKNIRDGGGVPSFLGYGHPPFPATICASVNDEVVHGIPGERTLQDGDVISIDCGAIVDGWHGDAADHRRRRRGARRRTRADAGHRGVDVGRVSRPRDSAAGSRDISHAVESYVRAQPHPTGGATGSSRTSPATGSAPRCTSRRTCPTTAGRAAGPKLERGLALAVEPMVTLGSKYTELDDDEWTIVTDDGSWAAHFEHTLHPDARRRLGPHRARRGSREAGRARCPYGGD